MDTIPKQLNFELDQNLDTKEIQIINITMSYTINILEQGGSD